MTSTGTAAVTGAGGCLGRALLNRLLPQVSVRALVRTENRFSSYAAERGCRVVTGHLEDEAALANLVEGAEVVFHCAAELGKRDPQLSHRVNVIGTKKLARAALQAGSERFVYVSSISVYGATRGRNDTFTEETKPENTESLNPYSHTKYLGEVAVRDLALKEGLCFTIVRPTNVYGPHSKPWFLQFERLLRWVPIAIGDLPIDVVYVDDLVDGMIGASRAPAAANQDFNLGHEMVGLNEFMLEVARVIRRRAWKVPQKVDGILRHAVSRTYRRTTGKPLAMPLERVRYYPHAKAREAFGYSPTVGLREGFDRITDWDRAGRP